MNLIILGPAGSGKGTQAEKLAKKFDLIHLDMGKLLRQVAKLPTDLGREIHEIINVRKDLVPSEITKKVLNLELGSVPREQGVVFDGVPRNLDQMEYINEALLEFGRKISKVFYIKINQEEGIRRISKRVICEKCKAGFILGRDLESLESQCPICEGRVSQREDDTEEGVKKRFSVFEKETAPIFERYKEAGVLVEVDGKKEPEKVFADILKNLEN